MTLSASQLVMMRALDSRPHHIRNPIKASRATFPPYGHMSLKTVLGEGFSNIESLDGQLTFPIFPTQDLRRKERLAVPVHVSVF